MAYIGNSPGVASQRVVTQFTATSNQTTFIPTSGYTIGYLDVFLNGVKLVNGEDYTASNGTTVVLAAGAASGDSVEVVSFIPRGLSDGWLKSEADSRYLQLGASFSGDVSGTYSAITLANSGVTAGSYGSATNIPAITVDSKGRLTSVTNTAVSIPSGSLTFTGDVTGSGTTGSSTALTLANSGVTAGSYGSASAIPQVTVDSKGRVTNISTTAVTVPSTLTVAASSGLTENINLSTGQLLLEAGTGVSTGTGAGKVTIAIGQAVGTTSNVSFNNLTLAGELRGPSTLIIDPAAVGDDTGTVRVRGNLQVDGTTTTVNSTTLEVADLNITMAKNAANAAAADGAGITVAGASATLTYTATPDSWSFNKNLGIGTSSPAGPLEVIGTNGILITRSSKTANTSSSARILGGAFTGNTATAIFLDGVGGENRLSIGGGTGTGEPATSIKLYTGTAGTTSAGTERMAIDASGNVSILTGAVTINGASIATADSMLNTQVNSAGSFLTLAEFRNLDYTAGTRSFIRVRNQVTAGGSYSSYFGQGQDGKTYIIANNSARGGDLVIDGNTGNVGIREVNPSLPLHISGTNGYPNSSGTTEVGFLTLRRKSAGSTHGLWMGVADASPWGSWLQAADVGNFAVNYPLLLNPNGGNVGIGTSSPSAKLDVQPQDGGDTRGLQVFFNPAATFNPAGENTALRIVSGLKFNWYSENYTIGATRGGGTDIQGFVIAKNDTVRIAIASGGNVGIGTTSPDAGAKLTVAGGILTTSNFSATTGSTAGIDYFSGNLRFFAIGTSGSTKGGYQWIAKGADNSQVTQMTLDASGRLGIGPSSPSRPLDIAAAVSVDTTGSANKWTASFRDTTATAAAGVGGSLVFQGLKSTAGAVGNFGAIAGLKENSTNGNEDGYLAFFTVPNSNGLITERMRITSGGDILPGANGTQNFGSSSLRWNTIYTSDLSLSNGIGDWTIVEGEDDLFIYNNKRNRVYKFKLEEVDPALATPKRG
jgi:hypothetical protein